MTENLTGERITADVGARLEALRDQIERGKNERARAEANLETYSKQLEEVVAEMDELGVTPETIDAEIERIDKVILEALDQAEALLPRAAGMGASAGAGSSAGAL